ncbi:MAG: hypothetical protein MJZ98_07295, partial [Paludibacteraceae bacterium]|nr:hypothetical protein [Paludibacteraceae bacterium]
AHARKPPEVLLQLAAHARKPSEALLQLTAHARKPPEALLQLTAHARKPPEVLLQLTAHARKSSEVAMYFPQTLSTTYAAPLENLPDEFSKAHIQPKEFRRHRYHLHKIH